jgi:hypothetical protein
VLSCVTDKFLVCSPEVDEERLLERVARIEYSLSASPYDLVKLAVAFGADPGRAKQKLGVEISGYVKKPVAAFLATYSRIHGHSRVEKELLELYAAMRGRCVCPAGPVVPVGGGKYLVQRAGGIYMCDDSCSELAPAPILLYEHPSGCMLHSPPLALVGQPVAAVIDALKKLNVAEPELVARFLLPGICRDVLGIYIPPS